jgi:hypothetical protein
MKIFKEFLWEAHKSREALVAAHGGIIPSGYRANNSTSSKNPNWRLVKITNRKEQEKRRKERMASLSSPEEQALADNKANKLKKAGLDAHHITPLHYSEKLKNSMSPEEWEKRVKRDAEEGIYHGHHPKNLMGAVTRRTPEKRARTGIRHHAGGAHEVEGKTKDIAHVGFKGLLSAAHRKDLKRRKSVASETTS